MNKLKRLRGDKLLTQNQLAEKAGISRDTMNQVERGRQQPTYLTLCKLARALGVEPEELED